MNGLEFIDKVNENEKADLIPLGTEFQVYNSEGQTIGSVGVHRTVVAYNHDFTKVPEDLFSENYTFKEIVNE